MTVTRLATHHQQPLPAVSVRLSAAPSAAASAELEADAMSVQLEMLAEQGRDRSSAGWRNCSSSGSRWSRSWLLLPPASAATASSSGSGAGGGGGSQHSWGSLGG